MFFRILSNCFKNELSHAAFFGKSGKCSLRLNGYSIRKDRAYFVINAENETVTFSVMHFSSFMLSKTVTAPFC